MYRLYPKPIKPLEFTDDILIKRVLEEGDKESFRPLMKKYMPVVGGYLYGRTANKQDVEDILQETFFAGYLNLHLLKEERRFGPWIMKIAKHKLYDYLRKKSREPRLVLLRKENEGLLENIADHSQSAYQTTLEIENSRRFQEALESLKEKYRLVVYLKLIQEKNSREIGELLGLNESTVRMRLSRGLEKLRKKFKKE